MTKLKWTKEKPKADKEFILLTASLWAGHYDYKVYSVEFIQCDGQWFYALICHDGAEWGDYADLKCDLYCQLEILKP